MCDTGCSKKRYFNFMKTIFTNGCFDILHRGHFELLKYARNLGDHLIVAINTDSSVKRLKGENRPFFNQDNYSIKLGKT